MRYYFDLRDDDGLVADDEGVELADLRAAEKEAFQALADAVKDAFTRPLGHLSETAIQVRDESGPVMRVRFAIDIERTN
jgi:uncharacterized protein DUF6894